MAKMLSEMGSFTGKRYKDHMIVERMAGDAGEDWAGDADGSKNYKVTRTKTYE